MSAASSNFPHGGETREGMQRRAEFRVIGLYSV
jgi:hypothetical protein